MACTYNISPSLEPRGLNLLQHDDTPVHKGSSIETRFGKFEEKGLKCPAQSFDLNPAEHLWNELENEMNPRPLCLNMPYTCLIA